MGTLQVICRNIQDRSLIKVRSTIMKTGWSGCLGQSVGLVRLGQSDPVSQVDPSLNQVVQTRSSLICQTGRLTL